MQLTVNASGAGLFPAPLASTYGARQPNVAIAFDYVCAGRILCPAVHYQIRMLLVETSRRGIWFLGRPLVSTSDPRSPFSLPQSKSLLQTQYTRKGRRLALVGRQIATWRRDLAQFEMIHYRASSSSTPGS